MPCFDQPDIKARLTLSVTAPNDWFDLFVKLAIVSFFNQYGCLYFFKKWLALLFPCHRIVVSNAVVVAQTELSESKRWDFQETQPISTYLVSNVFLLLISPIFNLFNIHNFSIGRCVKNW